MIEGLSVPECCAGCVVETATDPQRSGFWLQHGTDSRHFEDVVAAEAWLREQHQEDAPA